MHYDDTTSKQSVETVILWELFKVQTSGHRNKDKMQDIIQNEAQILRKINTEMSSLIQVRK